MAKRTEKQSLNMNMQDNSHDMRIRKGNSGDYPFLSEGIYLAEQGHTGPAPWCALFHLSETEYKTLLSEILENEVEGQEWCAEQFYIACIGSVPVAGASAWIEAAQHNASALLMSTLMYHFISEEKRQAAKVGMDCIAEIRIPRTPGYLQIESIFTLPEFRKRGISAALLQDIITQEKALHPELPGAEILLSSDNTAAINTYQKCGFEITETRVTSNPEITKVFPGTGKIKMTKKFL